LVPLPSDPGDGTSGGDGAEDERTTVEQPPEEPVTSGPPTAAAGGVAKSDAAAAGRTGQALDEHWDDGTTMDEATVAGSPPNDGFGTPEETTVEEPRPAVARLIVIAGNDTGREFTLTPAAGDRPLTIGRAIENDVVLTDIAVSRKHLDLSWDGSFWVLKDRGSGNGTLVNDRVEDGACRLQHGDRIEIGHTVFKFDHTASRGVGAALGFGAQNEDDASTVAGRSSPRPTVKGPPPVSPAPRRAPASVPPGVAKPALPPARPRQSSQGIAATGAVSSRLALPPNPSTGVEDVVPPGEQSLLGAMAMSASGDLMLRGGLDRLDRSMTATAHVDPLPFAMSSGSMPPVHAYPMYVPRMSRKRLLGIVAAALIGAMIIGLIASVTTDEEPPSAASAADPDEDRAAPEPSAAVAAVVDGEPDVLPLTDDEPRGTADPPPAAGVAPPAPTATATPPAPAIMPVPFAPTPTPTPAPPAAPAPTTPTTPTTPAPVVPVPTPTGPKTPEPKAPEPKAPAPAIVAPRKVDRPTPAPTPPKRVERKVEKRAEVREPERTKPDRIEKRPPTSVAGARRKAQSLYNSKSFKGAAEAARGGADTASDESEAAELRKLAADYDALATALTSGDASATSHATDALASYKRALAIDKRLGGVHSQAIREKLAQVAPKAAAGFMAKGNYEAAKQAADTAVNFGAGSAATVVQVRQSLERKAGEFFANGQRLLASRPEEGKALLRRVQKIVPPDSPWYIKAYKALNTRPTNGP